MNRNRDDRHDHPQGHQPAEVRSRGISVRRVKHDVGVAEARRRFGGLDWMAAVAGLLAAIGALVLLSGLAGAAGTIGYQLGAVDATGEELSVGSLIVGIVVLLLAFFTGGWVAGRVARYDGGRNGATAAVLFLLLAAALAGVGAFYGDGYNLFDEPELPNWFSGDDTGPAAITSGLVGALVALLAGWLGGRVGSRYHQRADAVVTHTRADGGVGEHEGVAMTAHGSDRPLPAADRPATAARRSR